MHISEVKIPVRYAETDQMGVVYHANYLVWMEIGRTQFIKDLGFHYTEIEKEGYVSPVIDLRISYKKPCHYGEDVTVRTWIEKYDGLRTTYGYEILNGDGELSVVAESDHVCVTKENFRPISFRRKFPEWHTAYERAKK